MNDPLPPLIETPPGRYRHYRGGLYDVIGTARHSETLEAMTVYKKWGPPPVWNDATQPKLESDPNSGEKGLWVRPAAMFNETVTVGSGTPQPRFARISDEK